MQWGDTHIHWTATTCCYTNVLAKTDLAATIADVNVNVLLEPNGVGRS